MIKGKDQWETRSRSVILDRPPFVRVYQECVVTTRGEVVPDYYRVVLPQFSVCVPYTEDGLVITIWQYKHGPGKYSVTFPAGFVEGNELPEEACRRELLEETGFEPQNISFLGTYVDGGNQQGSTGHFFSATGCVMRQKPNHSDLETLNVRVMEPFAVDEALSTGEFAISHHVLAWLLARRNLGRIEGANRK